MTRAPRGSVAVLATAGLVLCLAGCGGLVIGLFMAERVYQLLPAILIDADAVGGAAFALGLGLMGLGALHIALAWALGRRASLVEVPVIVLAALMGVVMLGWSVAALVSVAAGTGVGPLMLPAAIGLALVAAAYGWVAASVSRLRGRPEEPD